MDPDLISYLEDVLARIEKQDAAIASQNRLITQLIDHIEHLHDRFGAITNGPPVTVRPRDLASFLARAENQTRLNSGAADPAALSAVTERTTSTSLRDLLADRGAR